MSESLQRLRDKWRHRGDGRPDFAIEPDNDQESVWDYPRPPRLEEVGDTIRVMFAGETIAETDSAYRVLETSHPPVYYFPPDSVALERVENFMSTVLARNAAMAKATEPL